MQQIGERTDLQGSNVILAHRLMKNSVTEKIGIASRKQDFGRAESRIMAAKLEIG